MKIKNSNNHLLEEIENKKDNIDLSIIDAYNFDNTQREIASINEKLIWEINVKNKEIIELDKDYRDLLANLSHDLRTPLTSIIGYLSLIDCQDDNKRYLDISLTKAGQLKELIEKFYEYSLVSSREVDYGLRKINLVDIFNSVLINYYDIFNDENKSIAIEVDDGVGEVYASEKLLVMIFNNLLDNMYKYSLGNNKIEIRKNQNIIIIFSNDTELEDGEYLSLLDRMRVIDNSRKSSGLGLSIVKEALDKIKWDYEVRVKNKKFYFTILVK